MLPFEQICSKVSKRVLSFVRDEIPTQLRDNYNLIINHDFALERTILAQRLDLERAKELFDSACFIKNTEILNVYINECSKYLWEKTEESCLNALKEVVNDLNQSSDLTVHIPFDQKILEKNIMGPTLTQTLRLFGFMIPGLFISPVLSIPGAVVGGFFAGATTTTTGILATTGACIGGAINGAIMAPIGGLALLAAGIATTVVSKVDYSHYTQYEEIWDQDFLHKKAVESVIENLQSESTIQSIKESIIYLIQQNMNEFNLDTVDLGNSILCSSRRYFSLETNFETWRVLSVELDASTILTQEICYRAIIFDEAKKVSVSKRFSKFRQLYLDLCESYPDKSSILATFPPRTFMKSTEIGFLKSRCSQLLSWIKVCESDEIICESKLIREFFNIRSEVAVNRLLDDWEYVEDENEELVYEEDY